MASTISAGTSAGTAIAIAGDTTGNLAFTTQAGTYTQTLPNATGTVMVSGNMPAFSAYNSTPTSCSNTVTTKILLQTETFDTNNNFASSTFTPTVAGYYQINAGCCFSFTTNNAGIYVFIVKNGVSIAGVSTVSTTATYPAACASTVVYMNGTTDYIELYGQQKSGSTQSTAQFNTVDGTYMSGCLLRTA